MSEEITAQDELEADVEDSAWIVFKPAYKLTKSTETEELKLETDSNLKKDFEEKARDFFYTDGEPCIRLTIDKARKIQIEDAASRYMRSVLEVKLADFQEKMVFESTDKKFQFYIEGVYTGSNDNLNIHCRIKLKFINCNVSSGATFETVLGRNGGLTAERLAVDNLNEIFQGKLDKNNGVTYSLSISQEKNAKVIPFPSENQWELLKHLIGVRYTDCVCVLRKNLEVDDQSFEDIIRSFDMRGGVDTFTQVDFFIIRQNIKNLYTLESKGNGVLNLKRNLEKKAIRNQDVIDTLNALTSCRTLIPVSYKKPFSGTKAIEVFGIDIRGENFVSFNKIKTYLQGLADKISVSLHVSKSQNGFSKKKGHNYTLTYKIKGLTTPVMQICFRSNSNKDTGYCAETLLPVWHYTDDGHLTFEKNTAAQGGKITALIKNIEVPEYPSVDYDLFNKLSSLEGVDIETKDCLEKDLNEITHTKRSIEISSETGSQNLQTMLLFVRNQFTDPLNITKLISLIYRQFEDNDFSFRRKNNEFEKINKSLNYYKLEKRYRNRQRINESF